MQKITCKSCGAEIEIDELLAESAKAQAIKELQEQHAKELAELKTANDKAVAEQIEAKLEIEKSKLATDADIIKQRLEAEYANKVKKQLANSDIDRKKLEESLFENKERADKLEKQLDELLNTLKKERAEREDEKIQAKRDKVDIESKLREEIQKQADETKRLDLAAKDKQIAQMQKLLEEAQRKANQGSQQMQGEIQELDLEDSFKFEFIYDVIEPVAKGVRGADILQVVRTNSGSTCGTIIWESKNTKNWSNGWIGKIKEDMRAAKANIPVIVTVALPADCKEDIFLMDGVWVCKPSHAIVLSTLLRKGILDSARERANAEQRGTVAESLYEYITGPDFIHQVENLVETFVGMKLQINKERAAYEKIWAQRESQINGLMRGTVNIIGSMQGIAPALPSIKMLELDSGEIA